MTHSWHKSLKAGTAGEDVIASLFPTWTRESGRKQDFTMPDGTRVEVKTESRTTAQTPNLALETESSPGRPGAIQRAVDDGVSIVVYLFSDGELFSYDAVKLLQYMKLHDSEYRKVKIPNKTYNTTIILIPRVDLKEVEIKL